MHEVCRGSGQLMAPQAGVCPELRTDLISCCMLVKRATAFSQEDLTTVVMCRAVGMDGLELNSRELRIGFAQPKKKAS